MASSTQGRPWRILFGVTFFVFGPCLLLAALISAWRTHLFLRGSESSLATVVQLKEIHSLHRRAEVSYAPVFTFVARDGRTYTLTSDMATHPSAFKVGEDATAHYPAGHPEQARLDSFSQLWLFDLIEAIFGVIFTLLMLAVIFARQGQPRVYSRSEFPIAGDQR